MTPPEIPTWKVPFLLLKRIWQETAMLWWHKNKWQVFKFFALLIALFTTIPVVGWYIMAEADGNPFPGIIVGIWDMFTGFAWRDEIRKLRR